MIRRNALNTSTTSTTSATGGGGFGISTSTSAHLVTPRTPSSKTKPFSTPGVTKSTPVVSTNIKKNANNTSAISTAASPMPTSQQKKVVPPLSIEKGSKNSAPSTPRCSSPTIDSNINIGRTGELINTFKNVFKQGDVNCVCYVEKTGSIWTGGSEGQFCIYDVRSNLNNLDFRRVSTNGPMNEISMLTFTTMSVVKSFSQQVECTVWTGFSNGKIIIWDAITINKVFEFDCHSAQVTQILCTLNTNSSKRYIWTSSMDRTIRIIDVDTFQPIQILTEQSPIVGMVYLEKFNQVWILSDDGQIKIRDSMDGKIIKEMSSMINSKQILHSGLHIWTCNSEGKLRIWDCEKMKCIKEIKAHENTINKILTTSKQVWSCGDDKVIHIFDSSTLKAIKKIKANSVSVIDMIELPNQRIFAFCSDSKVRIWECEGEPIQFTEPKTNLQSNTIHIFTTDDDLTHPIEVLSSTTVSSNTPPVLYQATVNTLSTTRIEESEEILQTPHQIQHTRVQSLQNPITRLIESQSVVSQPTKSKPKFTRGVSMDLAKIIGNDHYDFLKSNIIIDKNELFLEDHKEHKDVEYESSSEEDEDNEYIKSMKEAYEREIVQLRKQLQDTSSRIPRYKYKLKSKTSRLDDKEHELAEARTMIKNLEEMEEFHRHEYDSSKQLHAEEKCKMLEDRKEVFNKLKSIFFSLSMSPSKEIEETFAQDHEKVSIVDLLDSIFVKLEMERSLQEKENDRIYQEKLEYTKEASEQVCTKLDVLKKDSMSIEEQLKQLQLENSKLYEIVAEKDRTIQVLNRLLEDDSFFNEEDITETSVMV